MTTSTSKRSTAGARPSWRRLMLLLVGVLVLVLPATMALANNGQGEDKRADRAEQSDENKDKDNKGASHCDDEDSGPGHSDCKPDNNPQPENPPCDADHGHPGDNAKPCQEGPENPGSCSDGEDNDGDGLTDGDDPDCQDGEEPDTCNDGEDNDGDGVADADDPECQDAEDGVEDGSDEGATTRNLCTAAADDPGLPLTEDTVGQTLWDSGLDALNPLTEDPERNGPLSGAVGDAGTDTPLEPVTDEAACAVDLLIDEELGFDL